MRTIIHIFLISTLIACNSEQNLNNSTNDYLPESMTLWNVVGETESSLFFFFPNDTVIALYELRKFYIPSVKATEGSDFHASHIFIKDNNKHTKSHGYYKEETDVLIEYIDESHLKLIIKNIPNKTRDVFLLKKYESFDYLPNDPRNTYKSYLKNVYYDTLVRFTSENLENYLIYSKRGVDVDTLTLEVYAEIPKYSGSSENDTFFKAKENNKLYVVPKSYTNKTVSIGEEISFDVNEINKQDSLAMQEFLKMLDSLNSK